MKTYIRSCEYFKHEVRITVQIYYHSQKSWKKIYGENDL
jgi:hypothetical protein